MFLFIHPKELDLISWNSEILTTQQKQFDQSIRANYKLFKFDLMIKHFSDQYQT